MNQQMSSPPQGGSSTMKWLLIILAIIIVLGGGYWLYQKYGTTSASKTTTSPSPVAAISPSASVKVSPSASVPADWKTYEKSGFSFKYPKEWTTDESYQDLDAQATVQFKVGTEYIMKASYFQTLAKMLGVTGSTSVADYIQKKSDYYQVSTIQTSKVNNLDVTKVKPIGGEGTLVDEFIFISDGKSAVDLYFNKSNSNYPYSQELENQILSTFQFTQ